MALVEPGDIAELLASGQFSEGPQLEAKQGRKGFPRNAWETVSAFANSDGGVIVLGLAQDGDDWRVEGVEDAEGTIQDILNLMRNPQRISVEAARSADLWIEPHASRPLVIVSISPAPLQVKPVFINGNPESAWLRRGEADSKCTAAELVRMAREASPSSFDARVLPFLGLDDFKPDTVERYRLSSLEARPDLPHHSRSGEDYLRSIGAWRVDRERNLDGPTIAGILVLGTDEAIQAVRGNHLIDYRRIPVDDTPARRWDDRLQWSGNLFEAWETIFPRLTRGLPVPFRLQGAQRIDRPAGLDALREAFVNLLVHTDYQESDDSVILHRHDGYVFRNPGESRVNVQDLGVHDSSRRRNQEIAKLFNHVGLADRAGSGYIRIFDEWRSLGFRKPHVVSDPVRFQFVLGLSLAGLIPPEDRTWLESFGEVWREDEELALWLARRMGSVDNQTLREMTGQHMSDASKTLVSLKNRNFFTSHGSGRNVFYVLGPRGNNVPEDTPDGSEQVLPEVDHKPAEGDHLPPESDHKPAEGDHLAPEGEHKTPEGAHKTPEGEHTKRPHAYLHRESLHRIIEPFRDTRRAASGTEMRETILQLCAIEPLSVEQLAILFQRAETTMRRYVQALQRERRLRRAESIPGTRVVRYLTVPSGDARQQPLVLAPNEE